MPHFVIDYSVELEKKINPKRLVEQTYKAAIQSELFSKNAIKVRARSYIHHQTGDGHKDFANVTVHLLSGRTKEQKHGLTHSVLNQLKALGIMDVSLTVQIYDMDRNTYAKYVN